MVTKMEGQRYIGLSSLPSNNRIRVPEFIIVEVVYE